MDLKQIEQKWQNLWQENAIYKVDLEHTKPEDKFYTLVMFSYPSGDKLHVGHWYNYGPTDTYARFKFMSGKKVFQPMGFDAFGLPAENFAIKTGVHPAVSTKKNINYMTTQLKKIGAMYDWDNDVITCNEDYYKWTQWLFLKLYENKLAYRAEAPVNWCPKDKTVLANEQVQDGCCERCGTEVLRKNLTQWFFKITDYAQELLDDLEHLDWPESTKAKQREWIGRSEGAEIEFKIDNHDETVKVFTTRPDTLFGATFIVFAPEHKLLNKICSKDQLETVQAYIEKSKQKSEIDRLKGEYKTGVFTGAYAINPINNELIPIWVSDYVLSTYGTGIVMAVPGHDQRDFEFAKKFDLQIRKVILERGKEPASPLLEAYSGFGTLINSGEFNGTNSESAKSKIVEKLNDKAQLKVNFKLRDWLVSRQRYWGAPIPIIYDKNGNEHPIKYEELPVKLPTDVTFSKEGDSPLKTSDNFKKYVFNGEEFVRETDTLDTFVCSSWYFYRYMNNGNNSEAFNKNLTNKWLPIDKYVGGADHATMHLLYARFIHKALRDLGYVEGNEPFKSLTHQGMILGPDGQKMSKSKGNVVSPDEYVEEHGADVFRCALMFGFAYEQGGPWDDSTINTIIRFFGRIERMVNNHLDINKDQITNIKNDEDKSLLRVLHNSISGITEDLELLQFNTSIARLMEAVNEYYRYNAKGIINDSVINEFITTFIKILAPFAPHFAEELWNIFGQTGFVTNVTWPKVNITYLKTNDIKYVVQINGKIRAEINVSDKLEKDAIEKVALDHNRIQELLQNKSIKKIIFVPNKLINIVAV